MSLLDRIESVKQAALQELRAAQDLPSLERAKGAFLGGEGQFTALMKSDYDKYGKLIKSANIKAD